jgi:hypothetical protein
MKKKFAIKVPCTENWNDMLGSEAVRHCSKCRFNVYNFSEMSQDEIDKLLNSGQRVCAKLYLRPDGTYITKDCQKKIRRNRILKLIALAASIPLAALYFLTSGDGLENSSIIRKMRQVPVVGKVIDYIYPITIRSRAVMGEMCVPIPPTPSNNSQKIDSGL